MTTRACGSAIIEDKDDKPDIGGLPSHEEKSIMSNIPAIELNDGAHIPQLGAALAAPSDVTAARACDGADQHPARSRERGLAH